MVRADVQTEGRGQFGSSWHSEAGANLLFSFLIYPTSVTADRQFDLAKMASLALWDTLATQIHDLSIKWPNDLVWGRHGKLAGILIQNQWSGSTLRASVIGIGLNVNQTGFPPEAGHPTSLRQITGNALDLELLFDRILDDLDQRYRQLAGGHHRQLDEDYHRHLYLLDQEARFTDLRTGIPFHGRIRGVNPEGTLRVEDSATGLVHTFRHKEIRFP